MYIKQSSSFQKGGSIYNLLLNWNYFPTRRELLNSIKFHFQHFKATLNDKWAYLGKNMYHFISYINKTYLRTKKVVNIRNKMCIGTHLFVVLFVITTPKQV